MTIENINPFLWKGYSLVYVAPRITGQKLCAVMMMSYIKNISVVILVVYTYLQVWLLEIEDCSIL